MELKSSELGDNATYKNVYYHLNVLLFVLLPLMLLVVFNFFLIRSVKLSTKQRSQMIAAKGRLNRVSVYVPFAWWLTWTVDLLFPSPPDTYTITTKVPTQPLNKNTGSTTSTSNNNNLSPSDSSPYARSMPCSKNSTSSAGAPSSSSSSANNASSRQETRITVMLIAVVILFIVCQAPTACMLIYRALASGDDDSDQGPRTESEVNREDLVIGLGNIFNFLMSINSAGNFVLYCLLSQKYRRTFFTMFCPCLIRKSWLLG